MIELEDILKEKELKIRKKDAECASKSEEINHLKNTHSDQIKELSLKAAQDHENLEK